MNDLLQEPQEAQVDDLSIIWWIGQGEVKKPPQSRMRKPILRERVAKEPKTFIK